MKTLNEIMDDLSDFSARLIRDEIPFSYEKLENDMISGHPGWVLLDLFRDLDIRVRSGPEPTRELIKEALEGIVQFNKVLGFKELKQPINDLKKYLKNTV